MRRDKKRENDPTYELYNTLQQLKYQTSTSIWLSREIDKNTGLWYFVIVIPTYVMTLLVHHDFLKHFPIGEQYYPFILVLSIVALSVVLFMLYFSHKGLSIFQDYKKRTANYFVFCYFGAKNSF